MPASFTSYGVIESSCEKRNAEGKSCQNHTSLGQSVSETKPTKPTLPPMPPLKYPIHSPQHRHLVLSLYTKILRSARQFPDAKDAITEASALFHQNMHEEDPSKVELHLEEAEARLEMAMHYKIWQARGYLFPRQGNETVSDVTKFAPHSIPKYLASEYREELDEAERFAEYRKETGQEHRVEFDDDDEHRW